MEELKAAKDQLKSEIREAYLFLRKNNQTIPSETLEFMKDAALEKADKLAENISGAFPFANENQKNRIKAMTWWSNLSWDEKHDLAEHTYKRQPRNLTGSEVEEIWKVKCNITGE